MKEFVEIKDIKLNINHPNISDKNGEMEFYLENNFWSSSTIKRSETAKKIKVKTANINKEIEKYNSNFLIMDIEGGEKDIIPLINFDNINKLLIEFHPVKIISNEIVSNLIKFLIEQGFCLDLVKSEKNVCYFYKNNGK